jgi:hypothetical protein
MRRRTFYFSGWYLLAGTTEESGLECPSCEAQDSRVLERLGPGGRRVVVEAVEDWE